MLRDESLESVRIMFGLRHVWIYAPVLLAIITAYAAHHAVFVPVLNKGNNEDLAVVLISSVSCVLLAAAFISRWSFVPAFFFVLAFNFLIRELDDTKWSLPYFGEFSLRTKEYIYIALVFIGAWGFLRLDGLCSFFRENPLARKIFLGMISTYFVSQLVARRAFRGVIPDEKGIHIALEEITENFSHLSFLVFAVVIFMMAARERAKT